MYNLVVIKSFDVSGDAFDFIESSLDPSFNLTIWLSVFPIVVLFFVAQILKQLI